MYKLDLQWDIWKNSSKTNLVTKTELVDEAMKIFENTRIQRHLGAAISTTAVMHKVKTGTAEIPALSTIALTHPHEVYAAIVHGVIGRWQY